MQQENISIHHTYSGNMFWALALHLRSNSTKTIRNSFTNFTCNYKLKLCNSTFNQFCLRHLAVPIIFENNRFCRQVMTSTKAKLITFQLPIFSHLIQSYFIWNELFSKVEAERGSKIDPFATTSSKAVFSTFSL